MDDSITREGSGACMQTFARRQNTQFRVTYVNSLIPFSKSASFRRLGSRWHEIYTYINFINFKNNYKNIAYSISLFNSCLIIYLQSAHIVINNDGIKLISYLIQ